MLAKESASTIEKAAVKGVDDAVKLDLQLFAKEAGQGFDTFKDLKKALGYPGQGNAWHHIVEQSQIDKSGFIPTQIQNTDNIIAIDREIHNQISGYYNSIQPFSDNMRVRDWLAGQSFEVQYQFGLDQLKKYGVIIIN